MSWSHKRDYWGRFQVLSDQAPHADTRSQGARTFNSPDAYSGTVATLDGQQSGYPVMAIAELIVSVANYRGKSAEEWLELDRALKAVPRDPWKARMGEWSKSADLRTRNGDGITFCRVIKADHSDVEAETRFIVNVRDTARDLLDRSFDQCFITYKTRNGTTFRLNAEDGDLVETYGPFTLSPTREVLCKGGARLADHLVSYRPSREVVAYLDRDPTNLSRTNLRANDQSRPVILHLRQDIASRINTSDLEDRLVRELG